MESILINPMRLKTDYVLITAVHNEKKYLEQPIQSILSQTILPRKWIIVSDGSTDGTDEIVAQYSSRYDFIKLIRREAKNNGLDFSSKVFALHEGFQKIENLPYDFLGILDGDVSFNADYYEKVIKRFHENPKLGIAGGLIYDKYNGHCLRRSPDDKQYVSGCIQLFSKQCYDDIGGLRPVKEGGEDTIAVIMARMKGWEVELLEDITVFHHKPSYSARGLLSENFRQGKLFYYLGSHPMIEILKSIRKLKDKPYFLLAFLRLCGFITPYFLKKNRPVPNEFVDFLRKDQFSRLKVEILDKRRLDQQISTS